MESKEPSPFKDVSAEPKVAVRRSIRDDGVPKELVAYEPLPATRATTVMRARKRSRRKRIIAVLAAGIALAAGAIILLLVSPAAQYQKPWNADANVAIIYHTAVDSFDALLIPYSRA